MRKIKVNSRALMQALISKGVSALYAHKKMGISLTNFNKYLQRDKVIRPSTAKKLIDYFGETVIYVDEGTVDEGTESARSPTQKGKSPSADKGKIIGDSACTARLVTDAKKYVEDRSLDDRSY